MKKKILIIIFALLSALSCSSVNNSVKTGSIPADMQIVAVADPVFMSSVLGLKEKDEIFAKNLYSGAIQFSGGYVEKPENGMLRQSLKRDFSGEEDFTREAKNFLSEAVVSALKKKGFSVVPAAGDMSSILKIERDLDLSKSEDDGRDNISLPRYISRGVDINKESIPEKIRSSAKYLIIPVIENYYGHSGGFFNGQAYGCGAGARITLFILCIDTSTGAVVMTYSDYAKKMYDYKFRINNFEMLQELQLLEAEVSGMIRKKAFIK